MTSNQQGPWERLFSVSGYGCLLVCVLIHDVYKCFTAYNRRLGTYYHRNEVRADDVTFGCINAQSVGNKSVTLCRTIADDRLDVLRRRGLMLIAVLPGAVHELLRGDTEDCGDDVLMLTGGSGSRCWRWCIRSTRARKTSSGIWKNEIATSKGNMQRLWRTLHGALGEISGGDTGDHTADEFANLYFTDKVTSVRATATTQLNSTQV